MPIKHAALKQLRKDKKRQQRNQAVRSELRTLTKRLLGLLKGLGAAEAELVEPAMVQVFQPEDIPRESGQLFLDVVVRRGKDVIECYTTTPFAGIDQRITDQALIADHRYALTGFSFRPQFRSRRREPR